MLKRVAISSRSIVASRVCRCFCDDALPEGGERRSSLGERGVNQVNLMGRVGRDPEVRGSQEKPVVVCTLATNSSYPTKDNDYVVRTDWHRITIFNPRLIDAVAMNIRKGDRLFVNGRIRYDDYVDQRSGLKTRSCSVVANELINLTKKYLQESHQEEET